MSLFHRARWHSSTMTRWNMTPLRIARPKRLSTAKLVVNVLINTSTSRQSPIARAENLLLP